MIDRVHFENFKSLKNVTIDLGRLTVLVGPNGCGKSSVLEGTYLLSLINLPVLTERQHAGYRLFGTTFAGPRAPGRLASPGRPTILRLAMHENGGDELELTITVPVIPPHIDKQQFTVSINGPSGRSFVQVPIDSGWGDELDEVLDGDRIKQFTAAAYLRLDPTGMALTSTSDELTPRMGSDGRQLATALAWMKGAAEEALADVTSNLKKIVPGVKRIRTLRERVSHRRFQELDIEGQPIWRPVTDEIITDRFEIEFDNGTTVPSDLLSEGTVLALGLLTKLYEPERPRLILLDDIDRGLHVEAQARLMEVLRELLKTDPELQIVCTTHSPYLVDLCDVEEVRVLALDEQRTTKVHTLKEHPEYERYRYGVQAGELWSILGDSWVAKAEP